MEPKTIETPQTSITLTDDIWIVSYRIHECLLTVFIASLSICLWRVVECGATFSKVSAADLVHCNGDLCVLCSAPFEHNLDSTVFNQQRKMKRKKTENRERKTENGKLKHKLKTKNGSQIHFCCCAATDDRRQLESRRTRDE